MRVCVGACVCARARVFKGEPGEKVSTVREEEVVMATGLAMGGKGGGW